MTIIGELQPDAAAGARAAVATWLHELYPGGDPPWVAPLRPAGGGQLPVMIDGLAGQGGGECGEPDAVFGELAD